MSVALPAGRCRFQFCVPHMYFSEGSEMLTYYSIIHQKCAELILGVGGVLALSSKIPLLSDAAAWYIVHSTVTRTPCGCRQQKRSAPSFMHFSHFKMFMEKVRSR
jgi:hypothetical protein